MWIWKWIIYPIFFNTVPYDVLTRVLFTGQVHVLAPTAKSSGGHCEVLDINIAALLGPWPIRTHTDLCPAGSSDALMSTRQRCHKLCTMYTPTFDWFSMIQPLCIIENETALKVNFDLIWAFLSSMQFCIAHCCFDCTWSVFNNTFTQYGIRIPFLHFSTRLMIILTKVGISQMLKYFSYNTSSHLPIGQNSWWKHEFL